MSFFQDLAPCSYFERWESSLLAVGWLDSGHAFTKGAVGEEFFAALIRLCVQPWAPAVFAGRHPCPLCRFTGGPGSVTYQGMTVSIGEANVFVPGLARVYVAPTMIAHYIDAHEYAPPMVFQDAVLRCPEMRSMAYLKAIKALGLKRDTTMDVGP
ncbi:hypothetical protein D7V97_06655 [Corallococcus sp. CA053C]|uniref:DUF7919 family protein n=1 Tax=Corallococcus sp. CA053C TaxID=2316732 RepID=UPI000EA006B9|nr:hypothetical protein [Corallococcus sp. CA053C]RKH13038.1 hypothetical protein D7V97_06655 [Corallococcus sp. CA053C]